MPPRACVGRELRIRGQNQELNSSTPRLWDVSVSVCVSTSRPEASHLNCIFKFSSTGSIKTWKGCYIYCWLSHGTGRPEVSLQATFQQLDRYCCLPGICGLFSMVCNYSWSTVMWNYEMEDSRNKPFVRLNSPVILGGMRKSLCFCSNHTGIWPIPLSGVSTLYVLPIHQHWLVTITVQTYSVVLWELCCSHSCFREQWARSSDSGHSATPGGGCAGLSLYDQVQLLHITSPVATKLGWRC